MANASRLIAATLLLLSLHSPALGVVVYSESGDDELSFRNDAPTDLGLFMPGVNSVTGQVMFIGLSSDYFPNPDDPDNLDEYMAMSADVFSFEIPAGAQLDSIIMTSFNASNGVGVFIGLDDGPSFEFSPYVLNTFFPSGPDLDPVRKVVVAGLNDDFLAMPSLGGSGANPPLGPGQYTIYIQENSDEAVTDYSLQFNVSAATSVPESSSVLALSTACLGLIAFRRSRRRKRVADAGAATSNGQ